MSAEHIQKQLQKLESFLDRERATYRILPHRVTLHSAEDGVAEGVGSLEQMAPTLVLKTKSHFLAAIVSGVSRLSYKKIKKELSLKDVSLASKETVLELTGSEVGCVSLVQRELPTLVDRRLLGVGLAYGGCGVPRHTLEIKVSDLVRITQARVFDFTEPKSAQT